MNRFEMKPPQVGLESNAVQESPDLFDYGKIKDYTLFVFRAVKRHKLIAALVYALVIAVTGLLLWTAPKTYYCETRLLGQRNQVISQLAVPSRQMPYEADAPARAARETILSRESLLTLMDQTDLVNHFYSHRSRAGALKDWILLRINLTPSPEQKREAVLGMLQSRLAVTPLFTATAWQAEGTIAISVLWPDPKVAQQIVSAAQLNFLQARHGLELQNITEAISILEGHAAQYSAEVDNALEQLDAVRAAKAIRAGRPVPTKPRRRRAPNPELAQLKSMLEGKNRNINDLEAIRHRRLEDLKAQLTRQKATFADAHPAVLETQQLIKAANIESPQVTILRKELKELEAEYAQRGGPDEDIQFASALTPDIVKIQVEPRDEDSGDEYLKKYLLHQAVGKYTQLLDRIDSAKIELDTARAAFRYRYTVLEPPLEPERPVKPKPTMVLGAGAIAAFFLAFFAAAAVDIGSGEILERWQVERQLQLPVLSELPWP